MKLQAIVRLKKKRNVTSTCMCSVYLRNEQIIVNLIKSFVFAITNINPTYMLDMSDVLQFVNQVTREM